MHLKDEGEYTWWPRRGGLPNVRTNEYPLIVIPCSSGDESAYEQAEEEGAGANGRNGSNSANSLRGGQLKLCFKWTA
jgi:hypothetical protein